MYRSAPNVPLIAVPLLVAVAILGYLAGYHRVAASTETAFAGPTRVASVANVLLEYPASWRRVSTAPAIPGLSFSQQVLLAPAGQDARAGLIVGELRAGEPSPLPAAFLSTLRQAPRTEVMNFLGGQAYGYTQMSIRGYDSRLELFLIPNQGGAGPTALACYAAVAAASYLSQCGQIVAGFTFLGQAQFDLTPDVGYAHALQAAIGTLGRERAALRRGMAQGATPASVGTLATTLAARFAAAAAALAHTEAPAAANAGAAALATAVLRARDAYEALAQAIEADSASGYQSALDQVDAAEADVNRALESFALLGYTPS